MSGVGDDIYRQILNSRATSGGDRITDGDYTFQIRRLLLEKKYGGNMFIVETKVVAATPVQVTLFGKGEDPTKPVMPNKVGSNPTYIVNLNSSDSAPGNVKAFLLALDGTSEQELAAKPEAAEEFFRMMKFATSAANPFRGALIRDTTFRKPIKGNQKGRQGEPFMGHRWQNIPQTLEVIRAARVALDREDAASNYKANTYDGNVQPNA